MGIRAKLNEKRNARSLPTEDETKQGPRAYFRTDKQNGGRTVGGSCPSSPRQKKETPQPLLTAMLLLSRLGSSLPFGSQINVAKLAAKSLQHVNTTANCKTRRQLNLSSTYYTHRFHRGDLNWFSYSKDTRAYHSTQQIYSFNIFCSSTISLLLPFEHFPRENRKKLRVAPLNGFFKVGPGPDGKDAVQQ